MKRWKVVRACWALAAGSCLGAPGPLSPEQERASFQLADKDLVVELAAMEPDVRAPVAVAWDADGRMFVAEMTDYPSGPVNGRIRLLEDRDADGRYEAATVFATNLAFPNGVMAWKNGVLVTAAPDIWFLADTNNDGAADVREKLLTGFAEGNQQLRVNGLFRGIDNWIYGANGRSDGEVKWADGTPAGSIRRHDFRFRPETKQFEAVAGHSQFGMGHDDRGNRFPVFNNIPIRHVVIEDRYLARQPSLAGIDNVPGISATNHGNRVFAVTSPNLLIPQPIGFFTSACGPSVYRGDSLPRSYYGNYFVCEPVQNVVQRRVLQPHGSTFIAEYAHTNAEFLASSDPWFHGVFTATGPDGALYIVDFYRDLVEHPHWVAPELRNKIDWRKGEEHGRIWRVRAKQSRRKTSLQLSAASNLALVNALKNENGWVRDTAHRLLIERQARDAVAAIDRLALKAAAPRTRVHALNILAELRGLNRETLIAALDDPSAAVRVQAIRLLEHNVARLEQSRDEHRLLRQLADLAADPEARVRLQLACSLGGFASDALRAEILPRLASYAELDQWQALGILSSVGERPWPLAEKLTPLLAGATPPQLGLLERLSGIVAAGGNSADANAMFRWLTNATSPNRFVLLAAALDASAPARARQVAVTLVDSAMAVAMTRNLSERVRVAAIRVAALGQAPSDNFTELLNGKEPDTVQVAAAKALFAFESSTAAQQVFAQWSYCSRPARREIIPASVRRGSSALALLDAVEAGKVPLTELDPATRQLLEKSSDAELKRRAAKLFLASVSPDRESVVQKLRASLKLAGDRKHGAELFERTCAVCHQMQGVGAQVGPDLSGIGQQPRETLLVQILDPSRQVLPDFVSYTAETKSGETYTGFVASESATTVTLRRANEPDVTLNRSELKELRTSGKSLMPDGLEAGMTEQDVADLIEFLRRPDRTLFTQIR